MGFGESILGLTGLDNKWIAKGVAIGLVVLLLGRLTLDTGLLGVYFRSDIAALRMNSLTLAAPLSQKCLGRNTLVALRRVQTSNFSLPSLAHH